MSQFFRAAGAAARALPILLAVGGTVIATVPAFASNAGGSAERNGPEMRFYSTEELSRMSQIALWGLIFAGSSNRMLGEMRRYNFRKVIVALHSMWAPTTKLMQRIDGSRTLADRKEIVDGLLVLYKARLAAAKKALDQAQDELARRRKAGETILVRGKAQQPDEGYQAYLRLEVVNNNLWALVRLLEHMKRVNDAVRW